MKDIMIQIVESSSPPQTKEEEEEESLSKKNNDGDSVSLPGDDDDDDANNNNNNNSRVAAGPCCWYWKYGKCEPPRPPCRFRHDIPDDCNTPCCFGATCRLGHKRRVTNQKGYNPLIYFGQQQQQKQDKQKNGGGGDNNNNNDNDDDHIIKNNNNNNCKNIIIRNVVGKSPAVRDATLLRSQLEPWSTAILRQRLVSFTNMKYQSLDGISRGKIMQLLLEEYSKQNLLPRKVLQIEGIPVDLSLCTQLLDLLKDWRNNHGTTNTRPSINATSYMILRHPREFDNIIIEKKKEQQQRSSDDDCNKNKNKNNKIISHQSQLAMKKLEQYRDLFDLAERAIQQTDPNFAKSFTALAVTYGFHGSPHIDKQNTGPFYGLSLGDFGCVGAANNSNNNNNKGDDDDDDDSCRRGIMCGGVCVEVDPYTVAHCDTHNRLAKVDGRYPHWVAPYEGERYSLIYYSTKDTYQKPGPAYFGNVITS